MTVRKNTGSTIIENLTNKAVLCAKDSIIGEGFRIMTDIEANGSLDEPAFDEKSPRQNEIDEFNLYIKHYDHFPELQALLMEFKDVFIRQDEFKLNMLNIKPVKIPIKSPEGRILPTQQFRGRRYKPRDIDAIDQFIKESLESGLIEPSVSAVQNPLHIVRTQKYDAEGQKIGEKVRITHDARKNNELNAQDFNYAFPIIEEELAELTSIDGQFFASLDMKSGFQQIPIHEESRPLFAFPVYDGAYKGMNFQYTRLLFGWKTCPAIFSDVMSKIFFRLGNSNDTKFARFIDDIAYASKNKATFLKFTRVLLTRCKKFKVLLNFEKCDFGAQRISFCGHSIDRTGTSINPKRVEILKKYPAFDVRTSKKNADLTLLGFYGYHSKWVKNYSKKDREIRTIIQKFKEKKIEASDANKRITEITDSIRDEILSTKVVTPAKSDTITLCSDSSGRSWGGAVYCDRGVIAYCAGSHSEDMIRTHSTYLLELRALALSIKKFHKFLVMAGKIIIKSDNISSTFCLTQKHRQKVSARALQYIQNIALNLYNITDCTRICHINGTENLLVDALSRLSYDEDGNFCQLDHTPRDDLFFGKIAYVKTRKQCRIEKSTKNPINEIENENTLQPSRLTSTPQNSEKNDYEFYKSIHSKTHWSVSKAMKTFKSLGYHPDKGLLSKIEAQCATCRNPRRLASLAPLHPKPTPAEPFEEIHIDFIDKKFDRSTRQHVSILTIICAFSRYAFAFPMKQFTINPVINKITELCGILGRKPSKIYGDNAFESTQLHEFCDTEKIKLALRASHLSRSVMVERWHRSFHEKMKSFCVNQKDWDLYCMKACKSLNEQVHDSTGFSPIYLFYGTETYRNMYADTVLKNCRHLAKLISDKTKKGYENKTYKFPNLLPQHQVLIRYDPSKSGQYFEGEVLQDDGTAEVLVKLTTRRLPIKVHKGHVYLEKGSPAYAHCFQNKKKESSTK